jgi:hypothetical protein
MKIRLNAITGCILWLARRLESTNFVVGYIHYYRVFARGLGQLSPEEHNIFAVGDGAAGGMHV